MARNDGRRVGRIVKAAGAATAMVLAVVACDPPPPTDGRDLGVTTDVGPDEAIMDVGWTNGVDVNVVNHGSDVATGAELTVVVPLALSIDSLYAPSVGFCDLAPVEAEGHRAVRCPLGDVYPEGEVALSLSVTALAPGTADVHLLVTSDGTEDAAGAPNQTSTTLIVRTPPGPLPVGSGTNHLGTAGVPGTPDVQHLAISTYCTAKAHGDRYSSGFEGPDCTGAPNAEFEPGGQLFHVDVPEARTGPLEILLFDAPFDPTGVDLALSGTADPSFTFQVLGADDTPDNDLDNPPMDGCTRTFTPSTPFDSIDLLGSDRWNRLCTISLADPAGRYLIRVHNEAVEAPIAGSNAFGILVRNPYYSSGGGLCDVFTDPTCASVTGPGRASISVSTSDAMVDGALAVVPNEARGKVQVELFDPGEGLNSIQILAPDSATTWAPVHFSWSSPGVGSGSGTSLFTANNRFNDRLVTITVDLADLDRPAANEVWKIRHRANPSQAVTDRSTVDVALVD